MSHHLSEIVVGDIIRIWYCSYSPTNPLQVRPDLRIMNVALVIKVQKVDIHLIILDVLQGEDILRGLRSPMLFIRRLGEAAPSE